jgi:hypothetical protein
LFQELAIGRSMQEIKQEKTRAEATSTALTTDCLGKDYYDL